jgi:hypothetical protein
MKFFEQELTVELFINYTESEKLWLPEFQRPTDYYSYFVFY